MRSLLILFIFMFNLSSYGVLPNEDQFTAGNYGPGIGISTDDDVAEIMVPVLNAGDLPLAAEEDENNYPDGLISDFENALERDGVLAPNDDHIATITTAPLTLRMFDGATTTSTPVMDYCALNLTVGDTTSTYVCIPDIDVPDLDVMSENFAPDLSLIMRNLEEDSFGYLLISSITTDSEPPEEAEETDDHGITWLDGDSERPDTDKAAVRAGIDSALDKIDDLSGEGSSFTVTLPADTSTGIGYTVEGTCNDADGNAATYTGTFDLGVAGVVFSEHKIITEVIIEAVAAVPAVEVSEGVEASDAVEEIVGENRVVRIVGDVVYRGTEKVTAAGQVVGGEGSLTSEDGTVRNVEIYRAVELIEASGGDGYVFADTTTPEASEVVQFWADGETFNYDTFVKQDVVRGLDVNYFANIKSQISSIGLNNPVALSYEDMRFSYAGSSNPSPDSLGYSSIAGELSVQHEPIQEGDIIVTIERLVGNSTYTYQAYYDYAVANLKEGVELNDFIDELIEANESFAAVSTFYFDAGSEEANLLYVHQDIRTFEADHEVKELSVAAGTRINEIFYGKHESGMRFEFSIYQLLNGNIQAQYSQQRLLTFSQDNPYTGMPVQYFKYYDVGNFSVYEGIKDNASGVYSLTPSMTFEGLDYTDENGDGVHDTQVYDTLTRFFSEPKSELLSNVFNEIPRNVVREVTSNYSKKLNSETPTSETVQQFDVDGNILYEHTRIIDDERSNEQTAYIHDNTTYYIYDESGNLVRNIEIEAVYVDDMSGFTSLTVDGEPSAPQNGAFHEDGTGVKKLWAQGADSQNPGSSGGSTHATTSSQDQQGAVGDPGAGTLPTTNKVRKNLSDYEFQGGESLTNWAEATGRISHEVAEKLRNVDEAYLEENREQIQRLSMANAGLSSDQMDTFYIKMGEEGGREAAIEYLKSLGLTDEQINTILNPTLSDAKMYLLSMYNYTAEEIDEFLRILNELSEEDALAYLTDLGLSEEEAQDVLDLETEDEMRAKLEELRVAMTEEEIEAMATMDEEEFLTEFMGYDEWTVNYILNPDLEKSEDVLSLINTASDKVGLDSFLANGEGDFEELQQEAADLITAAILNGEITPNSSQEDIIEILKRILESMGIDLAVRSTTDVGSAPSAGAYTTIDGDDRAMPQYLDN